MNRFRLIRNTITITILAAAAACMSIPACAGQWENLPDRSWVYREGSQKLTGWHWIDGNGDGVAECYYMDGNGTLKVSTTVDGWQVNADGAWVQGGAVQTQAVTPGSHHPAGSGTAVINSTSAAGSGSSASSGGYTPARARAEAVASYVTGTQAPYHGKVWTSADYYVTRSEGTAGKLNRIEQCLTPGCYNPRGAGSHCDIHTCKEPGCTLGVAVSEYNAGYCYNHMKAHGIDAQLFAEMDRAQRSAEYQAEIEAQKAREAEAAAARAAAEAQARAAAGSSSSKKTSSGGSSSKSSGSSGTSGSRTGSSLGSSTGSSGSSSGKKSTSYHDSYDDGYDDVYYNEWYDEDRYSRDWDYMSGVDDAMEDLDEDW